MVHHKKIVSSLVVPFLPLLILGCASTNVQLDVLNPAFTEQLRTELGQQIIINESCTGNFARPESVVADFAQTWKGTLIEFQDLQLNSLEAERRELQFLLSNNDQGTQSYQDISEAMTGLNGFLGETEHLRTEFLDSPDARFADQFPEIEELIFDNFAQICPASKPSDGEDSLPPSQHIQLYQMAVRSAANEISSKIEEHIQQLELYDLSKYTTANPSLLKFGSDLQAAFNKQAAEARGKVISTSNRRAHFLGANAKTLALSKLAYGAVSAGEEHWAERYNKARGWGVGGSTDIAIKLNETADFSIKGMVFDARATAQAARKLTTSAVQLLASGAGMPIKTQSKTDSSDATSNVADENKSVLNAKTKIAVAQQKQKNYNAAIKRIAMAVISSAEKAEAVPAAPPALRNAALAEYKVTRKIAVAVFAANQPLLSIVSP